MVRMYIKVLAFFIGEDGLAVSNYHVFQNTGIGLEAIKLAGDNHIYKVSHIYVKDEEHDFILFRVACKIGFISP